jgi:hypothetical protein
MAMITRHFLRYGAAASAALDARRAIAATANVAC